MSSSNQSHGYDTGPVSLVIKCLNGCVDPILSPEYTPVTASGEYEWCKEIFPTLIDSNLLGNNTRLTHVLRNAQSYSSLSIGRRLSCHIRLNDPSISGYHCRLIVVRTITRIKRSLSEEDVSVGQNQVTEKNNEQQKSTLATSVSHIQDEEQTEAAASNVYCYLIDTSTNGTFIGNAKVEKDSPVLVSSDEVVSLGKGKFDDNGDKLHTFAFTYTLSPINSSHQNQKSSVVELEDMSHSDAAPGTPTLTRIPDDANAGFPATSRLSHETQNPPWLSLDRSARIQQCRQSVPQIIRDQMVTAVPSAYTGMADPQFNNQIVSDQEMPPGETLIRRTHSRLSDGSHYLSEASQCFFQSPSPNPIKASPPPTARRLHRPTKWINSSVKTIPGQSGESQAFIGGSLASSATAQRTTQPCSGNRLIDLVKRVQEENMKKDLEIAELSEELEQSESLRQQMAAELTEIREELADKYEALERGEHDIETWRRQAENMNIQNSLLTKKVESTASQLKEVQSSRDQAISLLGEKREEVKAIQVRLEKTTAEYSAKLSSIEEEVQATQVDLVKSRNRISELEMEVDCLSCQKAEWNQTERMWEAKLSSLSEESRNSGEQLQRQHEMIEYMQETNARLSGYLRAALDLSLNFNSAEPDYSTTLRTPQTMQLCNVTQHEDEISGKRKRSSLFETENLLSMQIPTTQTPTDHRKQARQMTIDPNMNPSTFDSRPEGDSTEKRTAQLINSGKKSGNSSDGEATDDDNTKPIAVKNRDTSSKTFSDLLENSQSQDSTFSQESKKRQRYSENDDSKARKQRCLAMPSAGIKEEVHHNPSSDANEGSPINDGALVDDLISTPSDPASTGQPDVMSRDESESVVSTVTRDGITMKCPGEGEEQEGWMASRNKRSKEKNVDEEGNQQSLQKDVAEETIPVLP